jgi:hypothetical protein
MKQLLLITAFVFGLISINAQDITNTLGTAGKFTVSSPEATGTASSTVNLFGSISTTVKYLDQEANDYTILQEDHILIVSITDDILMNLPSAVASKGREYIIKQLDNGDAWFQSHRITIIPIDGEVIDDEPSYEIRGELGDVHIVSDGIQWRVLGLSGSIFGSIENYNSNFTPSVYAETITVNFTSDSQIIEMSLPAAASVNEGKVYYIQRNTDGKTFSSNVLKIIPVGVDERLNGYTSSAPYLMSNNWESVTIYSTGSIWVIKANFGH